MIYDMTVPVFAISVQIVQNHIALYNVSVPNSRFHLQVSVNRHLPNNQAESFIKHMDIN